MFGLSDKSFSIVEGSEGWVGFCSFDISHSLLASFELGAFLNMLTFSRLLGFWRNFRLTLIWIGVMFEILPDPLNWID